MAEQELKCPNCGAPQQYTPNDAPTIKCPFCGTVVVVPEELRQRPEIPAPVPVQVVTFTAPTYPQTQPARKSGLTWFVLTIVAIMVIGGFAALVISTSQKASQEKELALQETSAESVRLSATPVPSSTPEPTITPTPSFAMPEMTFGQQGIGEGLLNDARYIAVDGSGSVYVADYQGGRVQRFDTSGKYQSQWRINDDSQLIIDGLAANHQGVVYVSADNIIYQFNGQTGELQGTLTSDNGGTFGDIFATSDGRLAVMWYEGRWGLITSLEGHREDLLIYNSEGKVTLTVSSVISSHTNSLALDVHLAVDGTGKIYALSDGLVYTFSPQGKYLNSFGSQGDQPGQFQVPIGLAVDGQGRLYVNDYQKIHVFAADNHFIADFPAADGMDMIAIDTQGVLWGVSRDKVTRYVHQGP